MKLFFPCVLFSIFLLSCADQAETSRNVSDDKVFSDYQVWAEEGREEVTVRLQFRRSDEEGDAVPVDSPGKVLLDGEELTANSTNFLGVYYEVSKPAAAFIGEHAIVFIDEKGNKQQEVFNFEPFTLAEELPVSVRKKPFQIQLQGFPETATPARLVMVDTSLESNDVNEELLIENGKVVITEEYLLNLTKGPVTVEIYREDERPIKNNPTGIGKFAMTFALRRQFNLVE